MNRTVAGGEDGDYQVDRRAPANGDVRLRQRPAERRRQGERELIYKSQESVYGFGFVLYLAD